MVGKNKKADRKQKEEQFKDEKLKKRAFGKNPNAFAFLAAKVKEPAKSLK